MNLHAASLVASLALMVSCQNPGRGLLDDLSSGIRASEIKWEGIYGSQQVGDQKRLYCLLACGDFVARMTGVEAAVESWLEQHPQAVVHKTFVYPSAKTEWSIVLVVQGGDILNLDLVRTGRIPAYTLEMNPESVLIPRERYKSILALAREAEGGAKQRRDGIWGDEYDYSVWIRKREAGLTAYAEAAIQGKLDREPGRINYPAPDLQNGSPIHVIAVSKDANNNVYFVTNESFVSFNVGFIYKSGELLGDGAEPHIAETEHLFGRWWFYRAH